MKQDVEEPRTVPGTERGSIIRVSLRGTGTLQRPLLWQEMQNGQLGVGKAALTVFCPNGTVFLLRAAVAVLGGGGG